MKITERIPLEGSVDMKVAAFIDVEADSLEELINAVAEVKQAYAERLHVAPESTKAVQVHSDQEAPPNLAQRAAQSFGAAAKTYDPMKDGLGIADTCEVCGSETTFRQGVSKKSGKPWKAYFCNADKNHVKWVR